MEPPHTAPSFPILHHPSAFRHIPRRPATILCGFPLNPAGNSLPLLYCWILPEPPGSPQNPQDPGIFFQLPEAHWDPPETQTELKRVW
ncbi:hypothetical protein M422DRAFT_261256 [Sphaerobolus stellatus SS14]|uniref:Unplaced genomic scaffold SPHSTscaffold_104, whole genome shotgun sequence n=1 Tax=Sphaerobolus stellatus (strain SS14) TaxID=990650 RepID=A0A0C9VFB5_SPHS4|nr:hypothetical protein M422DRAFT_261256 [Sphaerobolus stellatus SS14]